jgi:hypothetical protein
MTTTAAQPSPPTLGYPDLLKQFWADVFGKEVQDATTYSYTWLADQVGHVCLGLLLNFLLTALTKAFGFTSVANFAGLFGAIILTSGWEYVAYSRSVSKATGLFPLGVKLLRNNAIIASYYMALGAIMGYVAIRGAVVLVGQETPWRQILEMLAVIVLGVVTAPYWLRQKIIWQKAALPYLFRLAEVQKKFNEADARQLQELIDDHSPPSAPGRQVVIGGPVGSGRTSLAAGIGTEFAFKGIKVRYVSFDTLLEFAVGPTRDDHGPWNIQYWPWDQAQVVIVDNIGPLISNQRREQSELVEQFREYLEHDLKSAAPVFRKCHSIWVIGDLSDPNATAMTSETLEQLGQMIGSYCGSDQGPLTIELPQPEPTSLPAGNAGAPKAKVRRVHSAAGSGLKPA